MNMKNTIIYISGIILGCTLLGLCSKAYAGGVFQCGYMSSSQENFMTGSGGHHVYVPVSGSTAMFNFDDVFQTASKPRATIYWGVDDKHFDVSRLHTSHRNYQQSYNVRPGFTIKNLTSDVQWLPMGSNITVKSLRSIEGLTAIARSNMRNQIQPLALQSSVSPGNDNDEDEDLIMVGDSPLGEGFILMIIMSLVLLAVKSGKKYRKREEYR